MRKMMPIGPLMIEHRLIEKMIGVVDARLTGIVKESRLPPGFIETVVDFIRTYADRCHHGKEENILFRELQKKRISPDHAKILEELVQEHMWARNTTGAVVDAYEKYRSGDTGELDTVVARLKELTGFYPAHIEKEDRHFFRPVMEYFSQEEKNAMLEEGFEFDRTLIHEKYKNVVAESSGER